MRCSEWLLTFVVTFDSLGVRTRWIISLAPFPPSLILGR
jgi:hypothetical protein